MLKDLFKKKELPNWTNITVNPIIAQALGFKSKASTFYLISDKESKIDLSFTTQVADNSVKEAFHKKRPLFRGIYCSAGMESTADIQADLQKYCDLTGQVGLVVLNGLECKLQPYNMKNRENIQLSNL